MGTLESGWRAASSETMRGEAERKAQAKLDEERAGSEQRLAAEQDPQLRASLQGAIAALDERLYAYVDDGPPAPVEKRIRFSAGASS